ncbi:Phosphatidylinositol 4-phosphate 5-kinase [Balamuthia mandrillaris]
MGNTQGHTLRLKRASFKTNQSDGNTNTVTIRFDANDPSCPYLSYTGQYKELQRGVYALHGQGRMLWKNGDEYEGQWRRNKRHGHGVMTWLEAEESWRVKPRKERYEGEWRNDRMHGRGAMEWSDGSCYCGEWRKGMEDGVGVYIYPNGDKWVGAWQKGKRERRRTEGRLVERGHEDEIECENIWEEDDTFDFAVEQP